MSWLIAFGSLFAVSLLMFGLVYAMPSLRSRRANKKPSTNGGENTTATPTTKNKNAASVMDFLITGIFLALVGLGIAALITVVAYFAGGFEVTAITPRVATTTTRIPIGDSGRHMEVIPAPVGKWSNPVEITEKAIWEMDCQKGQSFIFENGGREFTVVGGAGVVDRGMMPTNKYRFKSIGNKEVVVMMNWKEM